MIFFCVRSARPEASITSWIAQYSKMEQSPPHPLGPLTVCSNREGKFWMLPFPFAVCLYSLFYVTTFRECSSSFCQTHWILHSPVGVSVVVLQEAGSIYCRKPFMCNILRQIARVACTGLIPPPAESPINRAPTNIEDGQQTNLLRVLCGSPSFFFFGCGYAALG